MAANRVSIVIAALAAVAIAAVVIAGGGDDKPAAPGETSEQAGTPAPQSDAHGGGHETAEKPDQPEPPTLPDDPDAVRGTDAYALTRPANLRRALAVLDRRRRSVKGAFDGLRIAPGRIDTVIVHPDDRRTNIQVRADFEIAFETTHDFPTQTGFRKGGLTARDVNVRAPARLLRGIDGRRRGNAARDVDYVVIGRDIIDFDVHVTASKPSDSLAPWRHCAKRARRWCASTCSRRTSTTSTPRSARSATRATRSSRPATCTTAPRR